MRGFFMQPRCASGCAGQLLGSRCVSSRSSGRSVSSWSRSFSGRSCHRSCRSSGFFFFTASGQSSSSDHGGQNEGLVHDDFPYRGLKTISGNCLNTDVVLKTETKALELFCAQPWIIAFSLRQQQTDMKPSVTDNLGKILRGFSTSPPTSNLPMLLVQLRSFASA